MTIVYLKTTEIQPMNEKVQVQYHEEKKKGNLFITEIAISYDGSSNTRIFEARSHFYNEDEIMAKLGNWSTKINKIQAYLESKILQPDRKIMSFDVITDDEIEVDFTLDDKFPLSLDEAKEIKLNEISDRTSELIYKGYTHTFSNGTNTFPLSPINQSNWIGTQNQFNMGNITFDFPSTTIKGETYIIQNSELNDFMNSIFSHINDIRIQGRLLKNTVFNATKINHLSSIIDTR